MRGFGWFPLAFTMACQMLYSVEERKHHFHDRALSDADDKRIIEWAPIVSDVMDYVLFPPEFIMVPPADT